MKSFLIFLFIIAGINIYGHTHSRGIYATKNEALEMADKLGCKGSHKKIDRWLPDKDEKQYDKYLRK